MSHDLLFEIGVEELPTSYIPPALEQLEQAAREGLEALRLEFADAGTYATPRRLTLFVSGLSARQRDHAEEAMGPSVKVAYDAAGAPTRALLGFCQGRGVDPAAVRRVATPKGEYVAVTVHHPGRDAAEVLPALLAQAAARLTFPKTMRWLPPRSEADGADDPRDAARNRADWRFARPVRWLLALLDDRALPVKAFGLEAGARSQGHRFLDPRAVEVPHAKRYLGTLEKAFVIADHVARRELLAAQVRRVAGTLGGRVVADEELIEINGFLTEWPTAFGGAFDAHYLDLPREVIVTALREHQRFFAVESEAGALLPAFVAVRNGDERGMHQVRRGNEDVLIARLEDAKFYWETDLKKAPADQVEALEGVVWMEGLGSLRQKAARLESLAAWVAERVAPAAAGEARRAALLCKTDLLSEMIGSGKEYASLEGVMGGHYARRAGESEAVAAAIAEHYRPRGPGDPPPATPAGVALALADKCDHVAGAFVAGKAPSGSEDPYGVRRAGNGVVRILIEGRHALDLRDASMESTRAFFTADPGLPMAEIVKKLGEFWRGRVETALTELGGFDYDIRGAALEARIASAGAGRPRPGWSDPRDCFERTRTLAELRGDPRFAPLVILFKRVANILAKATETLPAALDRARLTESVEQALAAALDRAREKTAPLWERRAYGEILPVLLEMESAIHGFFDGVMVNADDLPTRLNRLRLLAEVRELFVRGWDLSKVVMEGDKA